MFPKDLSLKNLNAVGHGNMISHLGIEIVEASENHLKAKMPVDSRTKQPMGLLHGGASLALAETLGSLASTLVINLATHSPVGLEINANHIKSAREGYVYGTVTAIHLGKRTHVWEIKIHNDGNELVCISRLTTAIIENK